jgi:hypothetical protein
MGKRAASNFVDIPYVTFVAPVQTTHARINPSNARMIWMLRFLFPWIQWLEVTDLTLFYLLCIR